LRLLSIVGFIGTGFSRVFPNDIVEPSFDFGNGIGDMVWREGD